MEIPKPGQGPPWTVGPVPTVSGPRGNMASPPLRRSEQRWGPAEQRPRAQRRWTVRVHGALVSQHTPSASGLRLAPVGGNEPHRGIGVPGCVWLVGGTRVLVRNQTT